MLSPQSRMRAAVSVKVFPSAIISLKFNKHKLVLLYQYEYLILMMKNGMNSKFCL